MKIVDMKVFNVDCYRTNWVFIKIYTDEGIDGVGEATLEFREHALIGAIEDVRDCLIGKDPRNIEALCQDMYRGSYWRVGPVLMSAISGIEMALWDILGKSLGVPVYQLLGGKVRDKVKIYANAWFPGAKTIEDFALAAKKTKALGVKAIKWDPFGKNYMDMPAAELTKALECVAAVRDAVGPDMDLLIEAHGRFNVPTALTIARELEEFKPKFFEEPVPPDNLDALAYVNNHVNIPIAAGERLYGVSDFAKLLERNAVEYCQPDISHAGGILELKKISAMAQAKLVSFAPHNPSGPFANAASLQLAACSPNFEILETMITDIDWRKDLTNEDLRYEDGYLYIPDKPGLGIELNEEAALEHPYYQKHLRHYNGELTDIRPKNEKTIYYFLTDEQKGKL